MAMSINGTSGVTFPDASVQTTAPVIAPGTVLNTQIFNASGTWTKPATGTYVVIRLWAGGGGGGKAAITTQVPIGGTGGGFTTETLLMADMPSTVSVTVGAGGVGRTTTNIPSLGTSSWFGTRIPVTSMVVDTNYVVADYTGSTTTQWAAMTRIGNTISSFDGNFNGGIFQCRAVGAGTAQVANPLVYAQAGGGYLGQFAMSWAYNPSYAMWYEIIPMTDFITKKSWQSMVTNICNIWYRSSNSYVQEQYPSGLTQFSWFGGACGGSLATNYTTVTGPLPGTTRYGGAGGAASSASSGSNGTAPGGAGGATVSGATSGAGAAGRVEVYVLA